MVRGPTAGKNAHLSLCSAGGSLKWFANSISIENIFRSIHLHQYAMPSGGPTSHGCMRLVDSDARWMYEWTEAWKTTAGGTGIQSRRGRVTQQGTMVLVLSDEPAGNPRPFRFKKRYPTLKRVDLPVRPCAVPPGSLQQERHACS